MTKKPLVSIIVPIYNVERYLERCMDTLLSQSLDSIEIILVDDGSSDDCPMLCDKYAEIDNRVRVIHKANGGLGFARNSGLDIAEGEYVSFVDSDDYVTIDMCEKLYRVAQRYLADVVYGGVIYKSDSCEKISDSIISETVWRGKEQIIDLLLDFIATKPGKTKDTIMEVSVWKALFRRSIFQDYQIRFVSERQYISEDVIFDIDFLQRCSCVAAIPDPVYYYCVNPNSLTKTFRTDRFLKVKELYIELNRRLSVIDGIQEYQDRSDRFLIARARTNARAIVHHRKIIGKDKMKEALKVICEDRDLKKVLYRYPISKLPYQQFIIALFMKNRWYNGLSYLMRL